ncbi:hypothetical protein PFWH6_2024 [Pseudomonas fluorescens WH6]|nr:hypothetical protein PFWH6_2024 [Pseudomonas fluorescens WH6]
MQARDARRQGKKEADPKRHWPLHSSINHYLEWNIVP